MEQGGNFHQRHQDRHQQQEQQQQQQQQKQQSGLLVTRILLVLLMAVTMSETVMAQQEHPAGIYWKDLGVTVNGNNSHVLLHPFSGFVANGQVCGLLGPSGSGKSTFLAALSQSSTQHTGGAVWVVDENGKLALPTPPSV